MKKLLFSFILLIPSCGQYVEDRRSDDFEPIYLGNIEEEQVQPDYGAIYKPNQSRLFAMESRAHRVGDILTVSFTESGNCEVEMGLGTKLDASTNICSPVVVTSWR